MRITIINAIFICGLIMQISVNIWAICTAPWYGKIYAIIALAMIISALVMAWRKR